MKYVEKYANYLDSEGTIHLFEKLQKSLGDKLEPTAVECGITKASVYGWKTRKGDVKYTTKLKILEKLIEKLPLETFLYLTEKLLRSSSETLLSSLSTIFEQTFDAKDETEFLETVRMFENITEKYAGLIYKNRELEVAKLFLTMKEFSNSKNYRWRPRQTILLEYDAVKNLIPQIVASWFYSGFPQSTTELSERNNLPLDIVEDVYDEFNQQFLSMENESGKGDLNRKYFGIASTAASNLNRKTNPKPLLNKSWKPE